MALVKTIKDRLTHDTIYPITKADAVYLSDNETTVEGALGDLSTISSIGDGTIAGAISSLNTNLINSKFHVTELTITTISNSIVSPFSAFYEGTLDNQYGIIVAATAIGAYGSGQSGVPVVVKPKYKSDGFWVYSSSPTTVIVRFLFMKTN